MQIAIKHLELVKLAWMEPGKAPALAIEITREASPGVALYRELYDRVGRPWLWFERRLLSDDDLGRLLAGPRHEVQIARHKGELVGYFEFEDNEIAFFGLTPEYIGKRIGPWLLDRAIARAFERGSTKIILNTNNLDHPKALGVYRRAGFRVVRAEARDLPDPRVLWPDIYRWPPK
jgi:GNAT superfamily N-acetyltransferase